VVAYFTDRHQLISQVDRDLETSRDFPPLASRLFRGPLPVPGRARSIRPGEKVVSAAPFSIVLPRTLKAVQVRISRTPSSGSRSTKPHLATRTLNGVTETIVETGDLRRRTGERGRDEISRLSARLGELLSMLETSLSTQRQLVADASHELRTPITTLRANLELLAAPGALDYDERAELLGDVQDELASMTLLVTELIELARGEEFDVAPREFRLDEVVHSVLDRTAKRATGVVFHTELEPSRVAGVPERIERAVANLVDNACKWSPPGTTVDVAVHDGVVEVGDHGPGIPADDLPLIFNRFYRSPAARGMPGAGLGLAIVKQIADAHDGSATVQRRVGGGTVMRLALPSLTERTGNFAAMPAAAERSSSR
jgi:two-component system sensor histidine kinase MprB